MMKRKVKALADLNLLSCKTKGDLSMIKGGGGTGGKYVPRPVFIDLDEKDV